MSKAKSGGLTHGILYMLSDTNGARATEIMNAFPSIFGASTLTYLRRDGYIQHTVADKPTSPYVLTREGYLELSRLSSGGSYTPDVYWTNIWNVSKHNTMKSLSLGKSVNGMHFSWRQPDYMSQKQYGYGC